MPAIEIPEKRVQITDQAIDAFYHNVRDYLKGVEMPVRLMAIESGGVVVGQRLYEHLIINGIGDLGIFSIDVSRQNGRIKDRENIEAELSRYPGFLDGSMLIAIDDIALNGRTREIVDNEVKNYFRPIFNVGGYAFGSVVSNRDRNGRALADIYGCLLRDEKYTYLQGTGRLHIEPKLAVHEICVGNEMDSFVVYSPTREFMRTIMRVSSWGEKYGTEKTRTKETI